MTSSSTSVSSNTPFAASDSPRPIFEPRGRLHFRPGQASLLLPTLPLGRTGACSFLVLTEPLPGGGYGSAPRLQRQLDRLERERLAEDTPDGTSPTQTFRPLLGDGFVKRSRNERCFPQPKPR